jgi:hypothetical protein
MVRVIPRRCIPSAPLLGVTILFAAQLFTPAAAQDANVKVITTTLTRSGAHKECVSLSRTQGLLYWFRADAPVSFTIQHADGAAVAYPVKREKVAMASGTHYAKVAEVHCMVLTNPTQKPVTVRLEFARVER